VVVLRDAALALVSNRDAPQRRELSALLSVRAFVDDNGIVAGLFGGLLRFGLLRLGREDNGGAVLRPLGRADGAFVRRPLGGFAAGRRDDPDLRGGIGAAGAGALSRSRRGIARAQERDRPAVGRPRRVAIALVSEKRACAGSVGVRHPDRRDALVVFPLRELRHGVEHAGAVGRD